MTAPLAGCCLALVGLMLSSCDRSPQEASRRPAVQIVPPLTASQIASRLEVTRAESDSAVGLVLRSAVPLDTAVGYRVVVWDFRDRTRFLILGYLSPDPPGNYRPALFAIEDGRVSSPYTFRDNERVAVQRIADFDHDALPDVAMCASLEAREEVVVARVVGFRNEKWYLIPAASSAIPLCTSAALSWSP
jgi:hypothetical protein